VYLKKIIIKNFRNISETDLTFCKQFNIICGLNGQGKTNLIEAVYLLGNGRTFRSAKVTDLICYEKESADVYGVIDSCRLEHQININLNKSFRKVTLDGKNIHTAAELQGKMPVVVFNPDDLLMIKQGPDARRKYLDRIIYHADIGYLKKYQRYYNILKQRNVLLREKKRSYIDIIDEQLIEAGIKIITARGSFVKQLTDCLELSYNKISDNSEKVKMHYKPDVTADRYRDTIRDSLELDFQRGMTNRGPHRDDLLFLLNNRQLKQFGSQGQQRSFVLALKITELEQINICFGKYPILLLDDITSELDTLRVQNLISHITGNNIQTIITTTNSKLSDLYEFNHVTEFEVSSGIIRHKENNKI
jgi:DNA replication and repair protein RecF